MRIVYLHGLNSSPNSYKRQLLESEGHEVYAPFLKPDDWEASVLAARTYISAVKPDVIIGSSRGGAVAICANAGVPLILIAPAWSKYCPWGTISSTTTIIHSQKDKVVSFSDSELLAKTHGATLIQAGEDHRMNDEEATNSLLKAIGEL